MDCILCRVVIYLPLKKKKKKKEKKEGVVPGMTLNTRRLQVSFNQWIKYMYLKIITIR